MNSEAQQAYAERAWQRAYDAYAAAPELDAKDLDRFAVTAHLLGRLPDYYAIRERAYHQLLATGDILGAAQAAAWYGAQKLVEGEVGVGGAWIGRAAELVEQDGSDSVPAAFIRIASAFQTAAMGDLEGAAAEVAEVVAAGRRLGDRELVALALHQQGLFLLEAGRHSAGLAKLDEAMLSLTSGGLSAMVEGIVYCGTIAGCWSVYDLHRAQEWTAAMARWCAGQPELANFTGECKVRRAELKHLNGEWHDALDELTDVGSSDVDSWAVGMAACMRGNIDRLLGRFDDAAESFAEATRLGFDPQPGLALLRLAQGSVQAAEAMVRRCLAEPRDDVRRVEVLAAAVEIELAAGARDEARAATDELRVILEQRRLPILEALTAQASAMLALADEDPGAALGAARTALRHWVAMKAPYQEARSRELIATACRALGDAESADVEIDTAKEILRRLGAKADLDRLSKGADVLSARELEVLRLVATGATNRAIAERLVLSERTVDRHVSNILAKLDVPTRAAATAYAFERQLV